MFNKNIGFDMLTDSSMPRKVGVWDLSKKKEQIFQLKTKPKQSQAKVQGWKVGI